MPTQSPAWGGPGTRWKRLFLGDRANTCHWRRLATLSTRSFQPLGAVGVVAHNLGRLQPSASSPLCVPPSRHTGGHASAGVIGRARDIACHSFDPDVDDVRIARASQERSLASRPDPISDHIHIPPKMSCYPFGRLTCARKKTSRNEASTLEGDSPGDILRHASVATSRRHSTIRGDCHDHTRPARRRAAA